MRRGTRYILDAHGRPVPCPDLLQWAEWMDKADRRIAQDLDEGHAEGDRVHVSTVFLGLDHNYIQSGPPILWETMVFGGPLDGLQRRYDSLEAALAGHQAVCAQVSQAARAGHPPPE